MTLPGFTLLLTASFSLMWQANLKAQAGGEIQLIKDLSYREGEDLSEYQKERCKLDLYLPSGKKGFPTIVWFHGGGIQSGDKTTEIAEKVARRFAGEGIAVASVNYRLHPKVEFPAYIEDAAASIAFVLKNIAEHGGEKAHVFVSGHSAGGYLAAIACLDKQYLAEHGVKPVEVAGVFPVAGQMITHSTVRKEKGIPRSRPLIDLAAPAFHVAKEAPPFLCIVGENDMPMRVEENQYFVSALKATGHPDVAFLLSPGKTHGSVAADIGKPNDDVASAILAFINRLTKPGS